jgi:hypothetical protein
MGAGLQSGSLRSAFVDTICRSKDDVGYTPAAFTPPSPSLAPSMGTGLHAGSLRSTLVSAIRGSEDDARIHAGSLHTALVTLGIVRKSEDNAGLSAASALTLPSSSVSVEEEEVSRTPASAIAAFGAVHGHRAARR